MFTTTNSPECRSTTAGAFFLHSMAALLGCGLCADFAGVLLVRATGFDPASGNSNLLMWYSPFIWWAGLLLGLIVNWRSRDSVACLTWLSGALLLALLMADFFWVTRSWDRTMADVFPLLQGERSPDDALGVNQQLGSSIVFYPNHVKVPYSERFSLDLQYQIGKTILIEAGYIRNTQIHLSYSNDVSQTALLPYLSTSPYYDVYTTDKLSGTTYTGGPASTDVKNPFAGLTGMTGTYASTSTTLMAPSRYLLPYPQYTSDATEQLVPGAIAKYNALNARVKKEMGHGLTVSGVFEWSRLLGTFNQPNQGGPLVYGESTSDYPFHFSGYGTYDLPFGHGRQFFNNTRFLDRAIEGWQISAIYQFLSGTPDSWSNVIYLGNSWKDFHNKQHSSANWENLPTFNTSVFDKRTLVNSALPSQGDPGKANFNPAVQPTGNNYRTFPNYLLRSDYTSSWDGNVEKDITAWREAKMQFRLDCFNLLNRPQYAAPNLTPTSASFGLTRANGVLSGTFARFFQLSAHIVF